MTSGKELDVLHQVLAMRSKKTAGKHACNVCFPARGNFVQLPVFPTALAQDLKVVLAEEFSRKSSSSHSRLRLGDALPGVSQFAGAVLQAKLHCLHVDFQSISAVLDHLISQVSGLCICIVPRKTHRRAFGKGILFTIA